jgi:hypothetical protein
MTAADGIAVQRGMSASYPLKRHPGARGAFPVE